MKKSFERALKLGWIVLVCLALTAGGIAEGLPSQTPQASQTPQPSELIFAVNTGMDKGTAAATPQHSAALLVMEYLLMDAVGTQTSVSAYRLGMDGTDKAYTLLSSQKMTQAADVSSALAGMNEKQQSTAATGVNLADFSDALSKEKTCPIQSDVKTDLWLIDCSSRLHGKPNEKKPAFTGNTPAKTALNNLLSLLESKPNLTLHIIWMGEEQLPDGERWFDDVFAQALEEAGISPDRFTAYSLQKDPLADAEGKNALTEIIRAREDAVIALPALTPTADETNCVFTFSYQQITDGDVLFRVDTSSLSASPLTVSVTDELTQPGLPASPQSAKDADQSAAAAPSPNTDQNGTPASGEADQGSPSFTSPPPAAPDSSAAAVLSGSGLRWYFAAQGGIELIHARGLKANHAISIVLTYAARQETPPALMPYITAKGKCGFTLERENAAPGDPWYTETHALLLTTDVTQIPANYFTLHGVATDEQGTSADISDSLTMNPLDQTADGKYQWRVILPASVLRMGRNNLTFSLFISRDTWLSLNQTLDIFVSNRAPEPSDMSPRLAAYYDLPGINDKTVAIDLKKYFIEPDGEELTFLINGVPGSDILTLDQPQATDQSAVYEVVASDPESLSASVTLSLSWRSLTQQLNKWRFTVADGVTPADAPEIINGVFGRDTELLFTLPASDVKEYSDAADQYKTLPPLTEALKISAHTDDAPDMELETALKTNADGDLELTVVVPAVKKASQRKIIFSASVNGMEFPNLIPEKTIRVTNSAPTLQAAPFTAGTLVINDKTNPDATVPLNAEPILPFTLFSDDVTPAEELTYYILLHKGSVTLTAGGEPRLLNQPGAKYPLTGKECAAGLLFVVNKPGEVSLSLHASDAELECAGSFLITAKVVSQKMQAMTFIAVIAAGVVLLAALALILIRLLKPSLRGHVALIRLADGAPLPFKASLPLDVYGKDGVTVMSLLIAAHMPPMNNITSQALCSLTIRPLRKDGFRLSIGAQAADQLEIHVNSTSYTDEKTIDFKLRDALTLTPKNGCPYIIEISKDTAAL